MLRLTVSVPEDRNEAGVAELSDGSQTLAEDTAVATTDASAAKRQGNANRDPLRPPGHAPFGRYELTSHDATPAGAQGEYGSTLLLFEPKSGAALEAESFGRLGLLVYAGARGRDMFARRTQGGVRVSQSLMDALVARIEQRDVEVELRFETLPKPYWWAFWRKQRSSSLSKDGPRVFAPPLDEHSLAAELLKKAVRTVRAVRERTDDDYDRDRHRRDDGDNRSSSQSGSEVRGGGGTGGGGGASGAWSDAPTVGRGPGVDAAGRIIAAAGVGAVAAAVVAASAAHRDDSDNTRGNTTSDPTSHSTGESSSNSVDIQTNTAY